MAHKHRPRMTTALAEPSDANDSITWTMATQGECFDPEAGLFPSTITLKAVDREGCVVNFLPMNRPAMLHGFGIRPGLSKLSVALSMHELVLSACRLAERAGCGEVYFWGATEASTQEFAERHGFERIDLPLYRLRLSDVAKHGYGYENHSVENLTAGGVATE